MRCRTCGLGRSLPSRYARVCSFRRSPCTSPARRRSRRRRCGPHIHPHCSRWSGRCDNAVYRHNPATGPSRDPPVRRSCSGKHRSRPETGRLRLWFRCGPRAILLPNAGSRCRSSSACAGFRRSLHRWSWVCQRGCWGFCRMPRSLRTFPPWCRWRRRRSDPLFRRHCRCSCAYAACLPRWAAMRRRYEVALSSLSFCSHCKIILRCLCQGTHRIHNSQSCSLYGCSGLYRHPHTESLHRIPYTLHAQCRWPHPRNAEHPHL